ncbi:hypothetical protein A3860_39280 [Niastella vici]|uniref:Uncharacterized protein n=1 Tax=Niastella vici TaxID=1703345 RepID=A0A1V9FKG9_9BACT|nr:hypothetical protein [Niastella vici]OQP58854.1 hypothetical protein A3860_39280 [Niastella vici]
MKNGKIEVPLTSFIDFVAKSGIPKMTCAKKIKNQLDEPYSPAKDYYKCFRESVVELHRKKLDKKQLYELFGMLPIRKENNYREMESGYKKFMGNKNVTWFEPPRKNWFQGNLKIPINPEVALQWDDRKYLIKLYLKAEKPTKDRVSSVLALMKEVLQEQDCNYSLLDVRTGKLHLFEQSMLTLIPLVKAEAQSLEVILNQI